MNRRKSQADFAFVALVIALAVLMASVLATTPHLHQRLHGSSQHECVVTLIATGKCDHAPATTSFVIPDRLLHELGFLRDDFQISTDPLEFSLLEHAPPSVS